MASSKEERLLAETEADASRFEGQRWDNSIIDDNPFFLLDLSRCLRCGLCVQVCGPEEQYAYELAWRGRGFHAGIDTFYSSPLPETACSFCGQCVAACPTEALVSKRLWAWQMGMSFEDIRQFTGQSYLTRGREEEES